MLSHQHENGNPSGEEEIYSAKICQKRFPEENNVLSVLKKIYDSHRLCEYLCNCYGHFFLSQEHYCIKICPIC